MGNRNGKITIGIIIPFYEGTNYFDKLFVSIKGAIIQIEGKAEARILVIDNSDADYSIYFKAYQNQIIYIREQKKLGYGKACNVGYRFCRNENMDYIQIVNQDGILDVNCLSRLLDVMIGDTNIVIASTMPLTYTSAEIEPFFIKYYLQYIPALVTDLVKNKPLQKFGYETVKIPGICFMFRLKGNYTGTTLFDEKFFMYFEDEDLCKRLIEANHKIVLVPDAIFYHQHSHTTDTININQINRQNEISDKYFKLKHSKNKLASFYGLAVDDIFDSFKQLFRGNLYYVINKAIVGVKVLGLILKKK